MTDLAAPADTPMPASRARRRIMAWLLAAFLALLLLLLALGALTLNSVREVTAEAARAEQSLRQLENVRAMEAAFNNYLLAEIRRRLSPDSDPHESRAAAMLRGALLVYRRTIGEEISTAASDIERDAERSEMVRAGQLSSIFETIERDSMLERFNTADRPPGEGAAGFLAQVAAGRDTVFRSLLQDILNDEREEADAAFAAVAALRDRALVAGGALALGFVCAVAAFGALFYRGLMRPIGALTEAVERFPAETGHRAPVDLPGEFALLAERFNFMAARIESEQARLQREVAARTRDVTEANASLKRIDETRRAFLANISHELRTPVTILLGETQVALRSEGQEREALARIEAQCGYLRRRLEDLMRLARSEDGTLRLEMAAVTPNDPVSEAVEAVQGFARATGVFVVLDTDPNADEVEITGDAGALRQAALALIDNAIKFSPPGGTVTVRVTPDGFFVQDEGPGFGAADLDALTARYAQTEAGRNRGGSGLGLAIVKWIADQHGARLRATGGGEGARIGMEFPRS